MTSLIILPSSVIRLTVTIVHQYEHFRHTVITACDAGVDITHYILITGEKALENNHRICCITFVSRDRVAKDYERAATSVSRDRIAKDYERAATSVSRNRIAEDYERVVTSVSRDRTAKESASYGLQ